MSRRAPDEEYRRMLATTVLVASLGLADSINPVTILIAVYLGSQAEPIRRLIAFGAGVFATYLLGGLMLMLGLGELLHTALDDVEVPGADGAALVAGAGLVIAAVVVWRLRERVAPTRLPRVLARPRSALAVGAVVTALDLPTAFPYFGAIGVIVSTDTPMVAQILLLGMFNALYVLPIALILLARAVIGARCHSLLTRVTAMLERVSAPLLAGGAAVVGVVLVVRGAQGLLG